MKHFFTSNKRNPWFWLFVGLSIVLFFLIPSLSISAGNSGDEDGFQIPQGKNVVNYFKSDGVDTTCMSFNNLKYYGSSPDVIIEYFNETFHVDNIHITRHIFNSFFGWVTILMVGLIAYVLAGWRAAVLAMFLMFLSPRYLGHSFNNSKDVPFAAAIITSIYCIILFLKQFPKIKWYTVVLFVLSIALSISVRVGGLIIFGYFGLFGFCYLIKIYCNNKKQLKLSSKKSIHFSDKLSWNYIGRMLLWGIGICVIGFFAGILLWPYAQQAPIQHIKESFNAMSTFATAIRQLFEGTTQWSDMLPWYYTPKYILMTIPVSVIVGTILFFIFCWRKKENAFWSFFIFFTFFFPVFWIVYTKANVYGGWRHAMFAYPPMVVAAGLGFNALIQWIEKKCGIQNEINKKSILVNSISMVVFLLLLWNPIRHIINNHPYEYVYFNELAGGIDKAYGNYEMDYYYHSTREASEWILANALPNADGSKIKVATWHTASVNYFFRKDTANYQVGFSRWYEKGNNDWDYAIFTITGIAPEQIKNPAAFPPPNCVHTINVDGKPICLILKREAKYDLMGSQYKNNKQFDSAEVYLKKALDLNPYNEAALNNIIELYLTIGQPEMAKKYMDKILAFLPKYETANYFLAYYYIGKTDYDEAIKTCKFIIDNNYKFKAAYMLMCNIYLRQNDVNHAEKSLLPLIDADLFDNQAEKQLIEIYRAQGMDERSAYRKLYKKFADSFKERGKEKEYETYYKLYKQLR